MYFLYILQCEDGTLYTGITTNIARRLQEHKNGIGAHYTRMHGAEKIVYMKKCKDRSEAQKQEAQIKKLSRSEKQLLISQLSNLPTSSINRTGG